LFRAVAFAQEESSEGIHLRIGELLLLNNSTLLHSRVSYNPPENDDHDRTIYRSSYLLSWEHVMWKVSCHAGGEIKDEEIDP
jgi:hypothetical protein